MSMSELLPPSTTKPSALSCCEGSAGPRGSDARTATPPTLGSWGPTRLTTAATTAAPAVHFGQTRASFTDKTGTVFEGTKLPLRVWLLGLYLYKLGLSVNAARQELGINYKTAKRIKRLADLAVYEAFVKGAGNYDGQVELDEIYLTAGHKGQPQKVQRAGRAPRKRG